MKRFGLLGLSGPKRFRREIQNEALPSLAAKTEALPSGRKKAGLGPGG